MYQNTYVSKENISETLRHETESIADGRLSVCYLDT